MADSRILLRDDSSCIKVDGSANNISLSSTLTFSSEFTHSIWFNAATALSIGGSAGMIFGNSANNIKIGYSSAALGFRVLAAGTFDNTTLSASKSPLRGDWNHMLITRDSNNKVDVYINGGTALRLFSDAAQSGSHSINQLTKDDSTQRFIGLIDNFASWGRCLTAAEALQVYLCGVESVSSANLLVHYKFNEGSGTSAIDSSSNSNTGTLTSCTYSTGVFLKPRGLAARS